MSTYYINADSGVNAGGRGTSALPWLTLAYAITNSTSGDTIYCQNATATYTWATAVMATGRTLTGQSAAGVVFDGGAVAVQWQIGGNWNISNITFRNADNKAANYHSMIGYTNSSGGVSGTCTITDCIFHNLTVWNAGPGAQPGVIGSFYAGGVTFTVTSCLFYNLKTSVGGQGQVFGLVGSATHFHTFNLTNCTIAITDTSNYVNGIIGGPNNAITSTVKNCVVRNGSGGTVTWSAGTFVANTATYSDFYLITGSPTGTGVITTDPLFIDAVNGNLRLRPTSPCLDTGTLL